MSEEILINGGVLSTKHPANEVGPEELQNALKVTANIVERKNGAKYLNLTVDYPNNVALIQMTALNDQAKEEDARFERMRTPFLPALRPS